MADEKIEKVAEINQIYLADTLQFLSYSIEKQEVDDIEDKYHEQMRKAKKGNH